MSRSIISSAAATSYLPPQPIILAGEVLVAGDLAAMKLDGKIYKADFNGSEVTRCLGIVTEAAAIGEAVSIADGGWVDGETGLTPGQPVYLSETVNTVTSTPPAGAQALGYAITANVWVLRPDHGYNA